MPKHYIQRKKSCTVHTNLTDNIYYYFFIKSNFRDPHTGINIIGVNEKVKVISKKVKNQI